MIYYIRLDILLLIILIILYYWLEDWLDYVFYNIYILFIIIVILIFIFILEEDRYGLGRYFSKLLIWIYFDCNRCNNIDLVV